MPRPNIVLLFTDQQRFDTIGALGNPVIRTPHLDRLVREGACFTSAYTPAPVCVPARSSLIYGRYPHRSGCTYNGDAMPHELPSLMALLTQAGYRTHGVGKMHFRPDPQALLGFQTRERQEVGSPRTLEEDDYIPFLHASGYDHIWEPFGPLGTMYYVPQPAQMPPHLHGTHWVGDRATDFIRRAAGSQPFFLWASFFHPHPPFSPPVPWNKLYRAPLMPPPKRPPHSKAFWTYINAIQHRSKSKDDGLDGHLVRLIKAYYYACISFVDFQVGRILEALEETGQLDDTVILFTSDHGEFLGDYGCFGKRSMLDAAARVPLVARYPTWFTPGSRCDHPASLVDVMPTFLAAAGSDGSTLDLDGLNLAELAGTGNDSAHASREVYSQFQRGPFGIHMVANRRWKYAYSAYERREFLFDRTLDPDETTNRASSGFCQADLHRMRASLIDRYRDTGYVEPLDGGEWRRYCRPPLEDYPGYGLAPRDCPIAVPHLPIPGYSD